MNSPSNESIIAASLLVLDTNFGNTKRPLRPLVDADFDRIRCAKLKIARQWRLVEKHKSGADYNAMRSKMLDHWLRKHHWNIRTRNLYSSILAKLTVWEQHKINPKDQCRLQQLEPGARLFLQILRARQETLI